MGQRGVRGMSGRKGAQRLYRRRRLYVSCRTGQSGTRGGVHQESEPYRAGRCHSLGTDGLTRWGQLERNSPSTEAYLLLGGE